MVDLSPSETSSFASSGAGVVLFCRPGPAADEMRLALADVEAIARGAFAAAVLDVEQFPGEAVRHGVRCCPTCALVVGGAVVRRWAGLSSRARLVAELARAGVLPGPRANARLAVLAPALPASPLLAAVADKAGAIDELEEPECLDALAAELARGDAPLVRLAGADAARVFRTVAPACFALVREVPLTARLLQRTLRSAARPLAARVGLAAALLRFAAWPVRGAGGGLLPLLQDWLALQAACVEHLDEDCSAESRTTTVGSFAAAALPAVLGDVDVGLQAWRVRLAAQTAGPDELDGLLEDVLSRPLPAIWTPLLRPVLAEPGEPATAVWRVPLTHVGPPMATGVRLGFADGRVLQVVGSTVLPVEGPLKARDG